jgi:hypothetical protein
LQAGEWRMGARAFILRGCGVIAQAARPEREIEIN